MAVRRENRPGLAAPSYFKTAKNNLKKIGNWNNIVEMLTDPQRLAGLAALFIVFEVLLNIYVIENVRYTEIDWIAYMQEVEGFVNGTTDYSKLRGDTGPLVYPAGFVYFFTALYYITSHGTNIKLAQYIFAFLHITLLALVFRIYARARVVPPYVLILIFCTSYRIHSIFILRLFNDPIAVILLFASINAFLENKWYWGSVLYSLAVSVKMNILLFSPALLIAYLSNLGPVKTILHLGVCASIQLVLGLPFLLDNPYAYIRGAFDFGRVFQHKWTVNWRFLPEDIFVNPNFHIALLVLHLAAIVYFIPSWIAYMKAFASIKKIQSDIKDWKKSVGDDGSYMTVVCRLFVLPMFAANFIGIVFSRSLHYQFYVWYYHTLPYIAWHSRFRNTTRFVILGIIELCWNTYPSTVYSSAALHLCHLALLYGLHTNRHKNQKTA